MADPIDPASIGLTLPSGFVPGDSLSVPDQELQTENVIKLFNDAGVDINIVGEFYRDDIIGRNILNLTADAAMDTTIENVSKYIMQKTGKDSSYVTQMVTSLFYDHHLANVKEFITDEAKDQSGALGVMAAMQSYSDEREIDRTSKGKVEFSKLASMYGYDTKTFKPTEENKNLLYGKVAEDLTADELRSIYTGTRERQEAEGIKDVDLLPLKFTSTHFIPADPIYASGLYIGGVSKKFHKKMTQESFADMLYRERSNELVGEFKKAGRPIDWGRIDQASRAYADQNKIFYDDYKQYVIEALKDTDAEIMTGPLNRLESELYLRDVLPPLPSPKKKEKKKKAPPKQVTIPPRQTVVTNIGGGRIPKQEREDRKYKEVSFRQGSDKVTQEEKEIVLASIEMLNQQIEDEKEIYDASNTRKMFLS